MEPALQNKDASICSLVTWLRGRFGADSFDIVDHWDADMCAVGVARRDDHRVLAYVSTCGRPERPYYVELELPPDTEDAEYQAAGWHHPADIDALAHIVGAHLGLCPPSDVL